MTNQERNALVKSWRNRANDFLACAAKWGVKDHEREILRYHDISAVYNICADELEKIAGSCK